MNCPVHNWPLKDERGCWICLDELRLEGKLKNKPSKPKKFISKTSQKQQEINSELARIKKELLKENPYCFTTGRSDGLTLSHIIPRTYTQFVTDKRNLVLEEFSAHELYEHKKQQFAEQYPKAWQEKLKVAFLLCPEFYYKLIDKLKQAS